MVAWTHSPPRLEPQRVLISPSGLLNQNLSGSQLPPFFLTCPHARVSITQLGYWNSPTYSQKVPTSSSKHLILSISDECSSKYSLNSSSITPGRTSGGNSTSLIWRLHEVFILSRAGTETSQVSVLIPLPCLHTCSPWLLNSFLQNWAASLATNREQSPSVPGLLVMVFPHETQAWSFFQ